MILSMADSEGRVGSVSRAVTAFQMDGPGSSMGDLLLGGYAGGAKAALEPAIEPAVTGRDGGVDGSVSPSIRTTGATARSDARDPVERRQPAARDGADAHRRGAVAGDRHVSAQFNTSSLPPGRYLARGTLRQGGKPQGHMIRPFRIVAEPPPTTAGAPRRRPASLPNEMALVLLGGLVELRSQGAADAGDADVDVRGGRRARRPDRRRR